MSRPHTLKVITSKVKEQAAAQQHAESLVKQALGIEAFSSVKTVTSPKRDYQADDTERFNSLADAAVFFLNALPSDFPCHDSWNKPSLIRVIENLKKNFSSELRYEYSRHRTTDGHTKSEIDIYQSVLNAQTLKIIAAFMTVFGVSQTTASNYLSLAEQYMLLQKPREDLITFSEIKAPIDDGGNKPYYVIQRENPLPPFSDAIVNDMWLIKTASAADKLPAWYLAMPAIEKFLLTHALNTVEAKEEINVKLANLSSRLRTLPGVANYRRHEMILFNESKQLVDQSSSLASSMVSSRGVLSKGKDIRLFHAVENIKQIVKTNYEQALERKLKCVTETLKDGDEVTLPLNMLLQTLITPISGVGTPDAKLCDDKRDAIEQAHIELKAFFREPQRINVGGKSIKVNVDFNILSTNHPLNMGDKLIPTAHNDEECSKVIKAVDLFIHSHWVTENQQAMLLSLLKDYRETLADTSWGSYFHEFWNPVKRELILSSLEQLMFNVMNDIDYGSCVSGKDRKALELLYTDSMKIYRDVYGHYLPHQPDERQRQCFVSIFAQMYLTRHHHDSAGLNAPGANGTKTPIMYLPKDIQDEIRRLMKLGAPEQPYSLEDDDKIASNNDLDKIIGDSKLYKTVRSIGKKIQSAWTGFWGKSAEALKPAQKKSVLDEMRLSLMLMQANPGDTDDTNPSYSLEAQLLYCLTLIKDIVDNSAHWGHQGTSAYGAGKEPDGIPGIREALSDTSGLSTRMLPAIYQQVIVRSISCDTRAEDTQVLYNAISHLYLLSDNKNSLELVKNQLEKLYRQVMHKEPVSDCPSFEDEPYSVPEVSF